jgi:multidrug efflux pump subunit AcrB
MCRFPLALFVNYTFGFTINRVTLFALILSLGLVVDDPITNVDNIQRHIRMGRRNPLPATLYAVQEMLPPVIMSAWPLLFSLCRFLAWALIFGLFASTLFTLVIVLVAFYVLQKNRQTYM